MLYAHRCAVRPALRARRRVVDAGRRASHSLGSALAFATAALPTSSAKQHSVRLIMFELELCNNASMQRAIVDATWRSAKSGRVSESAYDHAYFSTAMGLEPRTIAWRGFRFFFLF